MPRCVPSRRPVGNLPAVRRILAALAAVAMLAAGFLVRRSLDDPQRGKAALRLACVPEAAAACSSVENSVVDELSPAEIEKALKGAAGDPPYDAVVTVGPWPERIKGRTEAATPTSDAPLVSSPVVVARRSGVTDTCASKLVCLVGLKGRASFPNVATTTSGAIIAAQTMQGGGVSQNDIAAETDKAVALIAQLRSATAAANGFSSDPITTLTSGGALLDAVVDARVVIPTDAAGLVVTPVVPATTVQLRLIGFTSDERLPDVQSTLRRALTAAGWQTNATSGIPDVGLMSATYARLQS